MYIYIYIEREREYYVSNGQSNKVLTYYYYVYVLCIIYATKRDIHTQKAWHHAHTLIRLRTYAQQHIYTLARYRRTERAPPYAAYSTITQGRISST